MFKAEVQEYLAKRNKYVLTYKMGLLSRKSCICQDCQIMYDCYLESCSNNCWPMLPKDIANGKLYGLAIVNQHIDWETGHVDDYDMEFVELLK